MENLKIQYNGDGKIAHVISGNREYCFCRVKKENGNSYWQENERMLFLSLLFFVEENGWVCVSEESEYSGKIRGHEKDLFGTTADGELCGYAMKRILSDKVCKEQYRNLLVMGMENESENTTATLDAIFDSWQKKHTDSRAAKMYKQYSENTSARTRLSGMRILLSFIE